jgi:ABC-type branched-subunit amino acid transport system substrate-binding protein
MFEKKSKILVVTITLIVASVALAGCHERGAVTRDCPPLSAAASPVDAPDPTPGEPTGVGEQLRLGSILPLTGDLSPFGPAAQNALNLAIDQVNAAGGVNGQDVQHMAMDSETRGEAAFSAATQLIDVDGVHAIIGAMGSGISMSFIDRVVDAQIPMVSPSNTGPDFTTYPDDGWYFRTVPSDTLQGAVMAQMLLDHGIERVSILALNNDYGVGFGDVVCATFIDAGGELARYVLYDPDGADFSTDVDTAVGGDPQAIVLISYPDTGTVILEHAYAQGQLDDHQWYFSEGLKSQSFISSFHADVGEQPLDGIWGTSPEELTDEGFLEDYEAAYGSEPTLFADRTYDAGILVMLGAEHCGCTGGRALLDSMRTVQNAPGEEVVYNVTQALDLIRDGQDIVWSGAAGPMEWDGVGDVEAPYEIWRIVNGMIEVQETDVWP